jgi:hypothetical protein
MLNINEIGVNAMIHARDHKTPCLIDPWDYLGPKRRKLLDASWAGLFREYILSELPVGKIASFYTDGFGRPTKEIYAALGALILQQMHDLTNEETVFQFSFNLQWHYALDIPARVGRCEVSVCQNPLDASASCCSKGSGLGTLYGNDGNPGEGVWGGHLQAADRFRSYPFQHAAFGEDLHFLPEHPSFFGQPEATAPGYFRDA